MGAIVLSDMVPIETRGKYQGINNIAWGCGNVMGAASGGWLADHVGWRWEFGLQVPFILACIVIINYTVPGAITSASGSADALVDRFKDFDFAGSLFLTTSLSFLIFGASVGGNVLPWTDWRVVGSLVLGLILGKILLYVEYRASSPVMPLPILFSKPRGLIIFNNFLGIAVLNAVCFFINH